MRTSKKIKDPVKAVIAIAIFIIFCFAVLALINIPVSLVRAQQFDAVIVGSSRAKWGINPEVIYEESGIRAINLASGPAAMKGRYDALDGAMKRYHPGTVILEIAYDAFEAGDVSGWDVYDSGWVTAKMVTVPTAARYLTKDAQIKIYDYDKIIGIVMDEALNGWKSVLTGKYDRYRLMAGAGSAEAEDWHLDPKKARETKWTKNMKYYHNEEDAQVFRSMVQMCNENGARAVVVSVPNTQSVIWQMTGWDERRQMIIDLLEGLDYEYYDYNLYKNREQFFRDEDCFRDEMHLSGNGAETFSSLLTNEILTKQPDRINSEELFYDSYWDAELYFRYADTPLP